MTCLTLQCTERWNKSRRCCALLCFLWARAADAREFFLPLPFQHYASFSAQMMMGECKNVSRYHLAQIVSTTLCVYQQCTLVQSCTNVVAKSEKAKAKKTKKAQFLEPAQWWCSKLSCKALCALPRGRSSQGCDAGMPIQDNSIGTMDQRF